MRPISEVGSGERSRFGGKACGLSWLMAAGVDVPPGFAVEATVVTPDGWPESLRDAFLERLQTLLALGPIAVRSSAPREDSMEASFAGQLETVLDVRTRTEALVAAARCVAAGASERVRAYTGGTPVPVGLVCQIQARARAAGVCFTRDPSSHDSALVVEAVHGLGEALVGGRTQPERWRVMPATSRAGWTARMVAAGGSDDLSIPALTEAVVLDIARLALDLERRCGSPLDLEWAVDHGGRLWWLQARPITAMGGSRAWAIERACPDVDDGPRTVWANWNLRETMPDPFSPLGWSVWRDVVSLQIGGALGHLAEDDPRIPRTNAVDLVQGRPYWNMNAIAAQVPVGWMRGALVKLIDEEAGSVVARLEEAGGLPRRTLDISLRDRIVPPLFLIAATVKFLVKTAVSTWPWLGADGQSPGVLAAVARTVLDALAAMGKQEHAYATSDLGQKSDRELLHDVRERTRLWLYGMVPFILPFNVGLLAYALARWMFSGFPDAVRLMTAGLTNNPTTRISLGLDDLVERARPIPDRFADGSHPEGRAWLSLRDEFLAANGQRCPMEFDPAVPRWSEDPGLIVEQVRARLAVPAGEPLAVRFAALADQRRSAIARAVASSTWWLRPVMRLVAHVVEQFGPLREAPKHHAIRAVQSLRHIALELGQRLQARGILGRVDDVFQLSLPELEALVVSDDESTGTVAQLRWLLERRRGIQGEMAAHPAPAWLCSDGLPVDAMDAMEGAGGAGPGNGWPMRGVAASGGQRVGRARVMLTPAGPPPRKGEVLVLPFADPGWTPLFAHADALVIEVGGLLCHAAVVAREMGIPLVIGVKDATRRVCDGQILRVDGDRGLVFMEGEAHEDETKDITSDLQVIPAVESGCRTESL